MALLSHGHHGLSWIIMDDAGTRVPSAPISAPPCRSLTGEGAVTFSTSKVSKPFGAVRSRAFALEMRPMGPGRAPGRCRESALASWATWGSYGDS